MLAAAFGGKPVVMSALAWCRVHTSDRYWKCLELLCWFLDLYSSFFRRAASYQRSLRAREPCVNSNENELRYPCMQQGCTCLKRHEVGSS